MMSAGPKHIRRIVVLSAIFSATSVLVGSCYFSSRYFIIDDLNYPELSQDEKSRLFSTTLPSRREIEDYYVDATLLHSHPPIGNYISYFRSDGYFFVWQSNELKRGRWSISPLIVRRVYENRSRLGVGYTLCIYFDDGSLFDDNCIFVSDRSHMFVFGSGRIERAKGDIFNMSTRKKAPFALPTTDITIGQMEATQSR